MNKRLAYDSIMHNCNPGTFILSMMVWGYNPKTFFLSITLSNIYGDHAWFWGKWSYKSLKRLLISFEIWLLHDHIKQIVINLKRTFSKSVKYFVRSGFPIMELHFIIWLPGELMFGKHENWPHHQFDHPAVYFSIKGF